jgi:NAD(P)-dependent dehydrogenase (short-subunit alcohol dehydrogenase family)
MLNHRVCIITGAGNGIGREHARLFASLGAKVVVNDVEMENAKKVADEIGGIANDDSVADFEGAGRLVAQAVSEYGRLDVLVNNAGILRDAFLHRMTEAEWDAVIAVHLKGHFAPLHHAAVHWRERSKAGETVDGAVINTASASGTFLPNPGQINYGAAKAGIAALSLVASQELERVGVRVNCIAPVARTRLTEDVPGFVGEMMKKPEDPDAFDTFNPAHISPLVAWLASSDCPLTGKTFAVQGNSISELSGWSSGETVTCEGGWTPEAVAERLGQSLKV